MLSQESEPDKLGYPHSPCSKCSIEILDELHGKGFVIVQLLCSLDYLVYVEVFTGPTERAVFLKVIYIVFELTG
jgi:hypothetical protein